MAKPRAMTKAEREHFGQEGSPSEGGAGLHSICFTGRPATIATVRRTQDPRAKRLLSPSQRLRDDVPGVQSGCSVLRNLWQSSTSLARSTGASSPQSPESPPVSRSHLHSSADRARATCGSLSKMVRNAEGATSSVDTRVAATMVAVLGPPSITAISPKYDLGPSVANWVPSTSTLALPSVMV